ncbi:MAG: DUF1684 domain-containing protein [Bacteroidota bacterium]
MYKITGLFFIILLFGEVSYGQIEEQSAIEFQVELTEQYLNPEESPLRDKAPEFKGHDFFRIDSAYIVEATFERTLNALPFQMKTTTGRLPIYEKYGEATFSIQGEKFSLSIYQSHFLRKTEEYKDHLFLPFNDSSNGHETYTGGRFIDLQIPEGNTILIDFNKAYNPFCAYAKGYSCPIPPEENQLPIAILAGIKKPKE